MSRQYMLDRWCVRCGRVTPSPYLVRMWPKMQTWLGRKPNLVLDIGCGNGRNCRFFAVRKIPVLGLDMKADCKWGVAMDIGTERWVVGTGDVDILLAQFVFMFLDKAEKAHAVQEINRVTNEGGLCMIELYPAKDSTMPTDAAMLRGKARLIRQFTLLGWRVLHSTKGRLILQQKT